MSDIETTTTTILPRLTPSDLPEGSIPENLDIGNPRVLPVETQVGATVSASMAPPSTPPPTSTTTTIVPLIDLDEERPVRDIANDINAFGDGLASGEQTAVQFEEGPLDYLQAPLGLEAVTQRGQYVEETRPGFPPTLITTFRLDPEFASNPALRRFESQMQNVTRSVLQNTFAPGVGGQQLPEFVVRTPEDIIDVGRGDRYTTEADVFKFLNELSVNELAGYKNELVSMGLITPNQRGLMQQKEINDEVWRASLRVAEAANENGYKFVPFIGRAISSGYQFAVPKSTGPQIPPLRLTSRDDIAYTANQIAAQRIGRSLNEAELDAFMTSYNDMERKFHNDYYSGRAEISEAPQVASAAQTMVQNKLEQEEQVYRMGSYLDAFRQMMGGRR